MIGYAVPVNPALASYRLRVQIPSHHIGMPYAIGAPGDVTFMYKLGNPELARECGPVVFDVVNDHFDKPEVRQMCHLAHTVTCGSSVMRDITRKVTGRIATVIDDPYETAEWRAECDGNIVGWFGHGINVPSLYPHLVKLRDARMKLLVCSNKAVLGFIPWSRVTELETIQRSAVVLLTGTNPGASSNRVVKALRAGRFVVAPEDCAESWHQFRDFIWIGDVLEGIRWAFNNRGEACRKVKAGQQAIRQKFSPQSIGSQWAALFGSILAAGTEKRTDGSG